MSLAACQVLPPSADTSTPLMPRVPPKATPCTCTWPGLRGPLSAKGPLIQDFTPISHTEGWSGLALLPGGDMR